MASKGEKISKSKGNSKVEPRELVKTHSADSIRYWAGTGRLGNDIIFSEETLARGQKLINKLWNVSKFIEMHIHDYNQNKEKFKEEVKEYNDLEYIDKWILAKYEEMEAAGEEFTRMDVVMDVAKDVALPVAVATASTASIILGFAIQTNRLKAVSAALAMVTEEHARYRLRAKTILDEETFKKIDAPLETKTVNVDGEDIEVESIVPNEGDFYGMWFKNSYKYASDSPEYNEGVIKEAENVLTEKMMRSGMLTFAEVLDTLGFEVPKAALPFGWTDTDGFYIEWDTFDMWDEEAKAMVPQTYVRWKTPRNLYATTSFKDFIPKKTRKELN